MSGHARSGSLSSLRHANVSQVLSVLQRFGGMTQIELADATNLSTATISSIVRELTEKGKVETQSVSRNGRHALYVSLAQQGGIVAGISIGRLDLCIILGDSSGEILCAKQMPLPPRHQPDTTVIRALELLREMLDLVGFPITQLKQITLALPAPIDLLGNIAVPEVMPGWDCGEVANRFERGTGVRPVIENDANMACLSQMRDSELNKQDIVYVHADYEIGGAIYIAGKIYRGCSGLAGEIGHVQVDANGAVCTCGRRGCLNTVASAAHLTSLLRPSRGEMSLRDIVSEAKHGDLVCMRLIEDAAVQVALAVEPTIASVDPGAIVVGGKLAQAGDGFLVAFSQALNKVMFPVMANRSIVLGQHGDDAVARGAMLSAANRIIMGN
ncbi:NagC family transcriptional regulator [Bifidobacterium lemurum]|uniref:NagC family transcriptional regulator n=1 Tax=Bifidobacterium lemurum TaxID=1603886 RepID=A0A261FU46_9BIFI|nr:ROK family transcriptional regulator [Bifidobacterium lemurum]OZG62711.1 NagC family transcriptional regulator [Bifidobacterium lemurum]QOL34572.1 ROK family transcriptional regulator [Bifidobacterium lemurum]